MLGNLLQIKEEKESEKYSDGNTHTTFISKVLLAAVPAIFALFLAYFALGYNTISESQARQLVNDRVAPVEQQLKDDRKEFKEALKENTIILREIDRKQTIQGVQIDTVIKNMPTLKAIPDKEN